MGKCRMMMRAALILGGLGVLTAMELGTPSRSEKSAAESPSAPPIRQAVPGIGSGDTLTKADRLEVFRTPAHGPSVAAVLPASLVEQADPVGAGPQTQQGADARLRAARAAVALPRPRPGRADAQHPEPRRAEAKRTEPKHVEPKHVESKHADSRGAARPDRTRPVAETRSCQANAFAGLLKALSLPTGCDT